MDTVTIFGPLSSSMSALTSELESRGRSCHIVTIPVAWFGPESSNSVIVAESSVGSIALDALAEDPRAGDGAHVWVLAGTGASDEDAHRWRERCARAREANQVTMVWCYPLGQEMSDAISFASSLADVLMRGDEASEEITVGAGAA